MHLINSISQNPFGMLMGERTFSSEKNRFSFNGQEVNVELFGLGNAYDFEYRCYNPRLGKFFSEDPLTFNYPYYSPYAFAGNKPIWASDLEGLEPNFERAIERQGEILTNTSESFTKTIAKRTQNSAVGNAPSIDDIQFTLDAIGMTPFVGELADGINGGIYLFRGQYSNASLSLSAMVPIAGWFATGTKWTNKAVKVSRKYGDEASDLVQSTIRKEGDEAKEIFTITKSGSFKDAKTVAKNIVGDLGDDAIEYKGRKGPFEGKTNGMQSKDGSKGYRVDIDKETGQAHLNWWNGKEKGSVPFMGGERQAKSIVENQVYK